MDRIVTELPRDRKSRASIIEINFYGIVGNAAYTNNTEPGDVDEVIKSALERRFYNGIGMVNELLDYDADMDRIRLCYLQGKRTNLLNIVLRTFNRESTVDQSIRLTIYWNNAPDNVALPDLTVFHDCHDYDCESLGRAILGVKPIVL